MNPYGLGVVTVHRGPARTNCGVDAVPIPVTFSGARRVGLRCIHRDLACAVVVAAAVSLSPADVDASAAVSVAADGDDGIRNVISDGGDDCPTENGPGDDARMSLTEADDVRETCFDCDGRVPRGENGDEVSVDSESDRIRDRRAAPGPDVDPGGTGDAMCGNTRLTSRDLCGLGAKPSKPKGTEGGALAETCCVSTSFVFRLFRFLGLPVLALSALALRAPTRTGPEAGGGPSAERVPDSESRAAGDPDSLISVWAD